MTNRVFIKCNGNKVISSVTNQNNNTGIICGVNYGNISKKGFEENEATFTSPFRQTIELESPQVFNWKGINYKYSDLLDNDFAIFSLSDIREAWNTHCFSKFLESLRNFDKMMNILTSDPSYKKEYLEESTDAADSITIFLGSLFENFEGQYKKNKFSHRTYPFFIDYTIDSDKGWVVGYDTEVLNTKDIFANSIYTIKTGDLHKLLVIMEDWLYLFHQKMTEGQKNNYKVIPIKLLKIVKKQPYTL